MEVRAWKNIESQGDSFTSRTGHTAIAHNQNVYLFGGTDCTGRQQDFFRFEIDTKRWTKVVSHGKKPSRRSGASGVVYRDRMYLFGGYEGRNGSYYNDLFCYDFETKNWNELKLSETNVCPQERTDHSMVVYGGNLYIFGGCDKSTRFDDLWRYDLAQKRWEQVSMSGDIPVPCFGHTAIVHENSHRLVVFGGWDGHNTLDNLYEFNFKTQLWKMLEAVGSIPPHRYRHSAVVFDDNMFVFGGVDKSQVRYNDLQRYNLVTNSWSEVCTTGNLPCSRTFHRAVLVENQMFLLGGYDGTYRLRDLYSIELGALCPMSLADLCAAFIRKNYRSMEKSAPFSALPADLLNHVVFRRDQTGVLRGKCNQCPDGRCDFYRHPRGKIPYPPQQSLEAAFECFCGHSNICHEAVDVSDTATAQRKPTNLHVSKVINDVYAPTLRLLRNAFCKRISDPSTKLRSSRPSRSVYSDTITE
ncbi:unnamed protein product [Albugo candida]|nr:unnamed protein product [Albugo candida]|eukprot:CCI47194.1 unnamed protein product [Albugo candida]